MSHTTKAILELIAAIAFVVVVFALMIACPSSPFAHQAHGCTPEQILASLPK